MRKNTGRHFFFLATYNCNNICLSLCRVDMDAKEDKKPEIDDKFWELLLSAEKKDYESIYAQYGVTDYRGILKKLSAKKIEREEQQSKVCFSFIQM